MFGTFGMEFSLLGPTLTKSLLKLDANTLPSSMTFPAILSCEVFLEVFFTFIYNVLTPSQFYYVINMFIKIFSI